MREAVIFFSDKSVLSVKEGDSITPIVYCGIDTETFSASMWKSMELWNHTNNGLLPSILDSFSKGDFFYLNHDYDIAYNSKAIVKIELS